MIRWQEAVGQAMGAIPCSPVERRKAFQYLHDSGIGYKLEGKIADTLKAMVEAGVVGTEVTHADDR